jgi:hypothetical protein
MNKLIQWMIGSTWFKKFSGIIGGFAGGMWVSRMYWREINATLEVWGIEADEFTKALLAVAMAAGIGLSVFLSVAKKKKDRSGDDDDDKPTPQIGLPRVTP